MQDNKGWNNNILKWASSLISGDTSSKNKADKITVSNYISSYLGSSYCTYFKQGI